MTVKSSISLTDSQDAFARALVARGQYPSVSAVLAQGLELLRLKTEAEELEIAALRKLVGDRLEGDFVSGETMESRISARADDKRRDYGL